MIKLIGIIKPDIIGRLTFEEADGPQYVYARFDDNGLIVSIYVCMRPDDAEREG